MHFNLYSLSLFDFNLHRSTCDFYLQRAVDLGGETINLAFYQGATNLDVNLFTHFPWFFFELVDLGGERIPLLGRTVELVGERIPMLGKEEK